MVSVDEEKCIGCGSCVSICEEVFEMNDEQKAQVKKGAENSNAECIKEAIDCCAVEAIKP